MHKTRGDQQVQGAAAPPAGQLHGQRLLPSTQRQDRGGSASLPVEGSSDEGHGPVESCQLQQARDEPRRLTKRQAEQDLDPFRDITA